MPRSKYSPEERLRRKRNAARLRQQRCRERKKKAAALKKEQEKQQGQQQGNSASASTSSGRNTHGISNNKFQIKRRNVELAPLPLVPTSRRKKARVLSTPTPLAITASSSSSSSATLQSTSPLPSSILPSALKKSILSPIPSPCCVTDVPLSKKNGTSIGRHGKKMKGGKRSGGKVENVSQNAVKDGLDGHVVSNINSMPSSTATSSTVPTDVNLKTNPNETTMRGRINGNGSNGPCTVRSYPIEVSVSSPSPSTWTIHHQIHDKPEPIVTSCATSHHQPHPHLYQHSHPHPHPPPHSSPRSYHHPLAHAKHHLHSHPNPQLCQPNAHPHVHETDPVLRPPMTKKVIYSSPPCTYSYQHAIPNPPYPQPHPNMLSDPNLKEHVQMHPHPRTHRQVVAVAYHGDPQYTSTTSGSAYVGIPSTSNRSFSPIPPTSSASTRSTASSSSFTSSNAVVHPLSPPNLTRFVPIHHGQTCPATTSMAYDKGLSHQVEMKGMKMIQKSISESSLQELERNFRLCHAQNDADVDLIGDKGTNETVKDVGTMDDSRNTTREGCASNMIACDGRMNESMQDVLKISYTTNPTPKVHEMEHSEMEAIDAILSLKKIDACFEMESST